MTARHRAFGLDIEAAFPLDGMPGRVATGPPSVATRLADRSELDARWSGPADPPRARDTVIDSRAYRAEQGAAGDLLMTWGAARFHLSADASSLLCSPDDEADPGWRRLFLDTVLATVSMRHGFELIHAGAVHTDHGLVAVIAGTGGGKSTLLAELARRGGRLFCDDLLAVRRADGGPVCEPGPPLMNLDVDAPGAPTDLGRELARLGGETWLAVDRHCTAPERLAAFVLLDRTPQATAAGLVPLDMPHLVLLAAALDTGSAAERRELRFRVMSDLADCTPGLRLRAPLDTPPADLAALTESAVAAPTGASR
jgi:hypothetical protein